MVSHDLHFVENWLSNLPLRSVTNHSSIQRVAFDGFSAGFADEVVELGDGQAFGGFGSGVVVDQFVDHGAVEVVGSEVERDLGSLLAQHDPVGFDVVKVVEHQPRDRHHLQVHHAARLLDVVELRVLRMERQRDEGLEAVRLVLQFAQLAEVVDAVLGLFDMAVEHRGVGAQAQLVSGAVDFEPVAAVRFVLADLGADVGMKNLRATAGHAAEARVDQLLQDPAIRLLGDVTEPVDFDSGPRLDVNFGVGLVDDSDDVDVPVEILLVMQAADDMNLCCAGRFRFECSLANHIVRERVAALGLQIRSECTEDAAIDADVRRVEMDVGVVEREVAVLSLAHGIGQAAERQDIDLLVEKDALVEGQAFAGFDFVGDLAESGVGSGGDHGAEISTRHCG